MGVATPPGILPEVEVAVIVCNDIKIPLLRSTYLSLLSNGSGLQFPS